MTNRFCALVYGEYFRYYQKRMWKIVDLGEDREICEMIQRKARETQLWCTYASVFTLCLALEECELSRGSYPSYNFY